MPRFKQTARRGCFATPVAPPRLARIASPSQPRVHPIADSDVDSDYEYYLTHILHSPAADHAPTSPPALPVPPPAYGSRLTTITRDLACIRQDYKDFLAQLLATDEADSVAAPDAYSAHHTVGWPTSSSIVVANIPGVLPVRHITDLHREESTASTATIWPRGD